MAFLVRLYRVVPFLFVLCLIAVLIYFIACFRLPNARAKQIVIRFFLISFGASSVFFLIATLYGFFDNNVFAAEIFAVFLITTLVGLGITALCNRTFLKHYPQYRLKAQESQTITWWRKLLELLRTRKG